MEGYRLDGKAALITGAASGIGRATAILFARAGAKVALVDIDRQAGEESVRLIQCEPGEAFFIRADVSKAPDCQRAVDQTRSRYGSLDILVNNAGMIKRATVVETSEEQWDQVMGVNLRSVFLMSKLAIPLMGKGGGGTIINVSSGWGLAGGPKAAAYCASKGAVVLLTKAMAIDHGGQNIRVNCICPGDTDTDMLRSEAQQLGITEQRFLNEAAQRPLRRIGKPEDIARAALYLAGEDSAYITGTTLVVDGGGLAGG